MSTENCYEKDSIAALKKFGEIIPTVKPKTAEQKRILIQAAKYLTENVDSSLLDKFELPTHETKESVRIIPCSGGKDSTANAILLSLLFPSEKFIYVFTDTKAEPDDIYNNLLALEELLDIEIVRLAHPLGLFGRIEKYGNYLPSGQNRWCTAAKNQSD